MTAKIHLIFKTHLDVGYTDYARNVVAQYFNQFIPQALDTAEVLRREGGDYPFIWTTGSWLVYEYLEQAGTAERQRMEQAILQGDIKWHGLPLTFHSELLDVTLFRYGLSLSQQLDRRFGTHTTGAKMTDVPGHTRGIVPLLAEAGIRFLHIGVNPASTTPDVPPVFTWRAPDGSEVVVMYARGTYGALQQAPGMDEALAFAHTNDNLGPQTPAQVKLAYAKLTKRFPDAQVSASTLDAYANAIWAVKDSLPVVTAEIGDTWNYGDGTDPKKVSQYRELLRLRQHWLDTGQVTPDDPHYEKFQRFLLIVPEHTWSLDEKVHLGDWDAPSIPEFQLARKTERYRAFEASWEEQRQYITAAVQALGDTPLLQEAQAALDALTPMEPDITGFKAIDPTGIETAHFILAFDGDGAASLRSKTSRRTWFDATHPLGSLIYQRFDHADYVRFFRQYIINPYKNAIWAIPDFTKPWLADSQITGGEWQPQLEALYRQHAADGVKLAAKVSFPADLCAECGCPRWAWLEYWLPDAAPEVTLKLQWFGKQAYRGPEALWLKINPHIRRHPAWLMDKLGQVVSPLEVVRNGNRKLHAVGHGVTYRDDSGQFRIETLDAPLAAPGERSLLNFNQRQPAIRQGVHFLLYDNLWGTNFPMWYEEDARFRFTLHFDQPDPAP